MDNEVTEMYCSCPYAEGGRNCKHMAAVLYEWSEFIEDEDDPADEANEGNEHSGYTKVLFGKAHTVKAYEQKLEVIRQVVEQADVDMGELREKLHVPMIDAHYHHCQWFSEEEDFITSQSKYRKMCGLETVNVLCLPNMQDLFPNRDMTQNILAAILKLEDPTVYAQGGFYYPQHPVEVPLPQEFAFEKQARELMEIGFDGIKMLESKPNAHKLLKFPPDREEYEAFFAYLEENRIPLMWHVNDPEEFWDEDKVSETAKKNGWFYGDGTFAAKEQIYEEVYHVLERHPKLHVTFPHCFFMSDSPERMIQLFEKYENVWIDLTPGPDMYIKFNKQYEIWEKIFRKYYKRIMFGTDAKNNVSMRRKQQIVDFVSRFLEEPGTFKADEYFGYECSLRGLGLDRDKLQHILSLNFRDRMGMQPRVINKDALRDYVERFIPRIPEGKTKEMILKYYKEKLQ